MGSPAGSPSPRNAPARARRLWPLLTAACLVPAVLDAVQTYAQARWNGDDARWQDVVFQGTEWVFLGALLPLTARLGARFPLRGSSWRRALAAHAAGALTLCLGWATLGVGLGWLLGRYPAGDYVGWILTSVPWSVFMYFTVLGCVFAVQYHDEARDREAQALRLSAQLADARLAALRMQIHPHFLFNSLNAITVLVREQNTAGATRMLELMSDLLRQTLAAPTSHETPLADELAFIERYLAIEQIRFSDRLRVHWTIEPRARRALVPGFVLQPLVENALVHGIARRLDSGRLDIAARLAENHLVLSVIDDGAGFDVGQVREGVGLANTRERLRTLYGERATLDIASAPGQGTRVTVRLPDTDEGS